MGIDEAQKYYVYVTSKEYGDELFNSKIVYQQSYPSIIFSCEEKSIEIWVYCKL